MKKKPLRFPPQFKSLYQISGFDSLHPPGLYTHRDQSSFFVPQKFCLNFYFNMFNDSVLKKRITAKKGWWLHKKISKVLEFGCVCLWLIWVKGTWPIPTQHQRSIVPRLRNDAIKYHSLYEIFDIVLNEFLYPLYIGNKNETIP